MEKTIIIKNTEELCDLMCDNKLPADKPDRRKNKKTPEEKKQAEENKNKSTYYVNR